MAGFKTSEEPERHLKTNHFIAFARSIHVFLKPKPNLYPLAQHFTQSHRHLSIKSNTLVEAEVDRERLHDMDRDSIWCSGANKKCQP